MRKYLFIALAAIAVLSSCSKGNDDNEPEIIDGLLSSAPTTGTAKATINGQEYDIPWVQLWANGPKFAKYNYDSDPSKMSETNAGTGMHFPDYFFEWGDNWIVGRYYDGDEAFDREPDAYNMYNLWHDMTKNGNTAQNSYVKCTFGTYNGVYGFMFTGVQQGYTDNKLFFPAESDSYDDHVCGYYWTSNDDGHGMGRLLGLMYLGYWFTGWSTGYMSNDYAFIRPILK